MGTDYCKENVVNLHLDLACLALQSSIFRASKFIKESNPVLEILFKSSIPRAFQKSLNQVMDGQQIPNIKERGVGGQKLYQVCSLILNYTCTLWMLKWYMAQCMLMHAYWNISTLLWILVHMAWWVTHLPQKRCLWKLANETRGEMECRSKLGQLSRPNLYKYQNSSATTAKWPAKKVFYREDN